MAVSRKSHHPIETLLLGACFSFTVHFYHPSPCLAFFLSLLNEWTQRMFIHHNIVHNSMVLPVHMKKKSPQFLTDINSWSSQQSFSEVKQTLMFTTPCVTLGWCPSNHPGLLALQWDWGTQAVGIWVPAGSTKRNHFFSEGKISRSHWLPAPLKVFFLFAWFSTSWL